MIWASLARGARKVPREPMKNGRRHQHLLALDGARSFFLFCGRRERIKLYAPGAINIVALAALLLGARTHSRGTIIKSGGPQSASRGGV